MDKGLQTLIGIAVAVWLWRAEPLIMTAITIAAVAFVIVCLVVGIFAMLAEDFRNERRERREAAMEAARQYPSLLEIRAELNANPRYRAERMAMWRKSGLI